MYRHRQPQWGFWWYYMGRWSLLPGLILIFSLNFSHLNVRAAPSSTPEKSLSLSARLPHPTSPASIRLIPTFTPTRTPTPINIGNFVWDDLDHDGKQDAGEPGIPGVKVQLWNVDRTIKYDADKTSETGFYTVIAPLPGDYRIRVKLPGENDQFTAKDAAGDDQQDSDINPAGIYTGYTDVITLASNVISITTIDAGIIVYRPPTPTRTPTPINIGNFIWDDLDHDGNQDAGEPGIPGVKVQLWNVDRTIKYDADKTSETGFYTVIAPLPGDYRVRVKLSGENDQFTVKDAIVDDMKDSDINPDGSYAGYTDVITLASNVISITTIDAGISIYHPPTPTRTPTPINIGNFVWNDLNQNGIQDVGEPGIPDVKVQLWNVDRTIKYDAARTSETGYYTVIAPIPGDYRVRVKLPGENDQFAAKDATGDDLKDSDINTAGSYTGYTDVITLASNVISITTIDAGIVVASAQNNQLQPSQQRQKAQVNLPMGSTSSPESTIVRPTETPTAPVLPVKTGTPTANPVL